MKTYIISLEEIFTGHYEVKAKNKADALKKAKANIKRNKVPEGIMNNSKGYRVEGVYDL